MVRTFALAAMVAALSSFALAGTASACGSDSDCAGLGTCSSGTCGHCGSDSDCHGGTCDSGRCSNATAR